MQDQVIQSPVSIRNAAEQRSKWWALAGLIVPLVALFGVWPYQHWSGEMRTSVLGGWLDQVLADSEWHFCLLVPLLVGWLIYRERGMLKALPVVGSWWGVVGVGMGLVLFWMGYKVDTGYPGFMAFHCVLGGLVLLLGGWVWLRALFFPYLFLAFMWPLFPLEERLAFPLRMMTASVSGWFLNLIGVAVVREGTALYSAGDALVGLAQGDLFRLDVEEPCSGIRSLFSLMMISALYGYLTLKAPGKRLVLFLSAIPMAMAGNFVRMVMLAVASSWFGSEFAVGRNIDGHQEMSFFHTMAGFAVFGVALAGMFGLCSVLERRHWRQMTSQRAVVSGVMPEGKGTGMVGVVAAWVFAGVGLAICAGTDASLVLAPPGVCLELPLKVGDYQGKVIGMSAMERDVLDEGVELARNSYVSSTARAVIATVITGGPGKRTLHRPEVCLPGQGWSIASSDVVTVQVGGGGAVEATLLRLFRDVAGPDGVKARVRGLNLYWYVGSDGTTRPDFYGHIAKGYQDAIFRSLNHRWSMVSVFVPLSEAPVEQEDPFQEFGALEETKGFLEELMPDVMKSVKSYH
jgi:exosortase